MANIPNVLGTGSFSKIRPFNFSSYIVVRFDEAVPSASLFFIRRKRLPSIVMKLKAPSLSVAWKAAALAISLTGTTFVPSYWSHDAVLSEAIAAILYHLPDDGKVTLVSA